MSDDNKPKDSKAGKVVVSGLCAGGLLFYWTPEATVKSNPVGDYWVEHALHVPPDLFDPETRAKGIVYSQGYTVAGTSTATATASTTLYPPST